LTLVAQSKESRADPIFRLLTEHEWDFGVENNLFVDKTNPSDTDAPLSSDTHPHMTPVSPGDQDETRLNRMSSSAPNAQKYGKEVPRE